MLRVLQEDCPVDERCARCSEHLRGVRVAVEVNYENQAGEPASMRSLPMDFDCAEATACYYRAHGHEARTV